MTRSRDEHAEVPQKAGLGLFCPPACYTRILALQFYIVFTDTTYVTHPTGYCETSDLSLILEAKVQPVDLIGFKVTMIRSRR